MIDITPPDKLQVAMSIVAKFVPVRHESVFSHASNPAAQTRGFGFVLKLDPTQDNIAIAAVSKGSPAEAAGLRKGDTITKIDSTPAKDIHATMRDYLDSHEKVQFTISRAGSEDIEVTLGKGEKASFGPFVTTAN